MITTDPVTGLAWAACDECGRPFAIAGAFDAYKTTDVSALIALAREHAWWFSEKRSALLCPAHTWLAPSTGLRADEEQTAAAETAPIRRLHG